ncbi:hypothetical protein J7J00_17785 [Bacillus sp. ISL-4]|uniref:hypothetical protein n=1 Tax=Bacillus sp. ISL-4 TaxID=2819125 RepID=UPI001BE66C65|nr:hypothetical protein [Bacillus sp. ISL-4]MBT2667331.1 hypothetical protein [Bacillus sp. ISL-4]MBT2669433.1 hypothetical protein [Streptomyces sp. ISL-14]
MKMAKKTKAKLPNVAFGFETEYHMTTDEVMVYTHLQFAKQVGMMDTETTRTTVDMLIDGLDWWTSKESRDRSKMRKILASLKSKGYITIEGEKILTITIVAEMRDAKAESSVTWKERPFKFWGYTEIYGDDYNLAENDGQKLMVIAYVIWRSGLNKESIIYKIANKEWELVLDVTDKTARDIVDGTNGVIKVSGAKYKDDNGQTRQETNAYMLEKNLSTKSKIEKAEQAETNSNHLEKFAEKVTDIRYKFDNEVLKQLNDFGTKLTWKGYEAWIETDCPVMKHAGEKKFETLEKSGNGWIKEKLEKEYEDRKAHERQQEALMNRSIPEDSYFEGEEFQSSFKRKETKNFDFLDEVI